MPLRSKPVAIQSVQNRSGTVSYRVLGTIRPKTRQRKMHCSTMEDALAIQAAWEAERLGVGAALRPKITRLTVQQISQAEAAIEMLKGTGLSIVDAARHVLRNPPPAVSGKLLDEALKDFLAERVRFVGGCQYENLRLAGEQFSKFVGEKRQLVDIKTEDVSRWLAAKGSIAKKTWNNYRNDLSTFFEWCSVRPRGWVADNPVKPIPQYDIVRSLPERLEVTKARELMAYMEEHQPDWCLFFALSLFLGVRPDMANGEIAKLAECVARDGASKYFCNGVLHITAEIAKDKRSRQTRMPANAKAWIDRAPITASAICPGDWNLYGKLRKKFAIPHDGLRHTAISAHVSLHGSFAEAASEFGNSETMIRTHYFNRMSKAEAEAFYSIRPKHTASVRQGGRPTSAVDAADVDQRVA